MKPRNGGGAKGPRHLGLPGGQLSRDGQEEPSGRPRPFGISKAVVWAAYKKVKANKGAAGIDGQSIAQFEESLLGVAWVSRRPGLVGSSWPSGV